MGGGGLLARACSSGTSGLHHHLNSHSFLISKLSSGVHRGIGPSSPAAVRHLLDQSGVCFGVNLLHLNPRVVQSVPFCCGNMDLPSPALQTRSAPKVAGLKISFCSACGAPVEERIPQGEEKPRYICTLCGFVHYQNPKMVVGCLVADEDKVLLCKRSIEPSFGLWTLPAGYMELGESAAEGAVRETWEEANAEVTIIAPFAQLDIPQIGQSYIIYRAKLKTPHFSPGSESLECALFKLEDIPFNEIAFSSIRVALKLYVEDFNAGSFRVHHGVIEKRPGTSPSDPSGYTVRDHVYS